MILVQCKQIAPFWILGLLAGALIAGYGGKLTSRLASKASGRSHRLFKLIAAAVLGALSPVTMYGMIPVLAALMRFKSSQSVISSFIITSVLINPNVFIYSFALGAGMAFLRLASCILAGVIGGLLVELAFKNRELFSLDGFAGAQDKSRRGSNNTNSVVRSFTRAMSRTAPNLALGITLAALFQVFLPSGAFDFIFRNNRGLSVLFAASLGVPAYYCGGGTIPLIRVWLLEGMSPGSAVAFMITGPATKLTNLTAVKTVMPTGSFLLYIAYNIAFGVLSGIIVDLIF